MSHELLNQIKKLATHLTSSEKATLIEWLQMTLTGEHLTKPKKSLYGFWANQGIEISGEAVDEARCEMWGNFPRDDI